MTDFAFYLNALEYLNKNILDRSDKVIGYYILERLAAEAPASLSVSLLNRLKYDGIITDEIFKKSRLLQKNYFEVDRMKSWTVDEIEISPEWHSVFDLSVEIIQLIKERWTDEDIEYLKSMS